MEFQIAFLLYEKQKQNPFVQCECPTILWHEKGRVRAGLWIEDAYENIIVY